MISIATKSVVEHNDTELVSESLTGSPEAFGRIVEQYQSLICSLAYSATGSLTQSEDLAQETFVIAWKQLRQLREPAKLRSWLCSIARSVISRATRLQTRQPAHGAETMDTAAATPAPDPIPSERAINREEEAILWRSLSQIPVVYREPLVLFYREQQSVADVALQLELSEDAVRQRLSRGRKLLTEEVTAFVEGTLKRTNPGKVFTLGVLAALSLTPHSAKAATMGATAAKAGAATKAGATLGSAGAFLPILGSEYFLFKSTLEYAKSPRERQFMSSFFWIQTASFFALIALLSGLLFGHSWVHVGIGMWPVLFLAPLVPAFALGKYAKHRRRQIQIEDGTWVEPMTHDERKEHFDKLRRNGSRGRMYLYIAMACNMGGLAIMELVHVWNGDPGHLLFLEGLSGFTLFLAVCAWRNRPR